MTTASLIEFGKVAAAIVAFGAVFALLIRAARKATRMSKKVSNFLEDWNGEPARPGVPGRPGAMERLSRVEIAVDEVRMQVNPNGGGSMRDTVNMIADVVVGISDEKST